MHVRKPGRRVFVSVDVSTCTVHVRKTMSSNKGQKDCQFVKRYSEIISKPVVATFVNL